MSRFKRCVKRSKGNQAAFNVDGQEVVNPPGENALHNPIEKNTFDDSIRTWTKEEPQLDSTFEEFKASQSNMATNALANGRTSGGPNCCVVGCSNNHYRDGPRHVQFYPFPKLREKERRLKWILSVNRRAPDGSLWQPTKASRVCSEHFVHGKSNDPKSRDYVPSIFPKPRACKEIAESSVSRLKNRISRTEEVYVKNEFVESIDESEPNSATETNNIEAKIPSKLDGLDFGRQCSSERGHLDTFLVNQMPTMDDKKCCVEGCSRRVDVDFVHGIKFYRFPSKDDYRREAWIQAINRINPDGTPWVPKDDSRVCSSHFEGGEKQDDPLSPAYIPSIFPKEQCNLKTSSVVSPSETEKEDHPLKISLVATKLSEEETPWQPVDEETVSCFGDEFLEIDCKKEVDMIDQSTQTTGTLETSDSLVWSCELEVNDEVSSCATMARVPSSKVIPPTWLKVSSQSTDLPSLESTIKVEY